jgi:hypothetical protein
MRFRSVLTAEMDRLDRRLESAHAATVALFREVMESAGERLSILRRAGKTAHIERSLAAGACTEAALALLELEMPNWKIRRLVNEGGGEWLCSLSRRPGVPTELDDMVEARHAVLSLAVLRALFEARRLNGAEAIPTPADVPLGATIRFCCDNFA